MLQEGSITADLPDAFDPTTLLHREELKTASGMSAQQLMDGTLTDAKDLDMLLTEFDADKHMPRDDMGNRMWRDPLTEPLEHGRVDWFADLLDDDRDQNSDAYFSSQELFSVLTAHLNAMSVSQLEGELTSR